MLGTSPSMKSMEQPLAILCLSNRHAQAPSGTGIIRIYRGSRTRTGRVRASQGLQENPA
jgi:hypothetical protein